MSLLVQSAAVCGEGENEAYARISPAFNARKEAEIARMQELHVRDNG